ncbi:MAG: hypothetical protein ACJAVK_003476 [Akkermansiaceae bacterium]|jgi:hypothetical protein
MSHPISNASYPFCTERNDSKINKSLAVPEKKDDVLARHLATTLGFGQGQGQGKVKRSETLKDKPAGRWSVGEQGLGPINREAPRLGFQKIAIIVVSKTRGLALGARVASAEGEPHKPAIMTLSSRQLARFPFHMGRISVLPHAGITRPLANLTKVTLLLHRLYPSPQMSRLRFSLRALLTLAFPLETCRCL